MGIVKNLTKTYERLAAKNIGVLPVFRKQRRTDRKLSNNSYTYKWFVKCSCGHIKCADESALLYKNVTKCKHCYNNQLYLNLLTPEVRSKCQTERFKRDAYKEFKKVEHLYGILPVFRYDKWRSKYWYFKCICGNFFKRKSFQALMGDNNYCSRKCCNFHLSKIKKIRNIL